MFYIKTLEQELNTAKTYEHTRRDETSVFDRHRCHKVAITLVCLLMWIIASFLRYSGYINVINNPINNVLLLILVHVLLPSCLYF